MIVQTLLTHVEGGREQGKSANVIAKKGQSAGNRENPQQEKRKRRGNQREGGKRGTERGYNKLVGLGNRVNRVTEKQKSRDWGRGEIKGREQRGSEQGQRGAILV